MNFIRNESPPRPSEKSKFPLLLKAALVIISVNPKEIDNKTNGTKTAVHNSTKMKLGFRYIFFEKSINFSDKKLENDFEKLPKKAPIE
jgi:hypothetical protein